MFLIQWLLRLVGWKPLAAETVRSFTENERAIMIYPHTSKWDSVIFGLYILAFPEIFAHSYTLFAARFFWGPLRLLLKRCNCIPVENQKNGQGQLQKIVNFLRQKEIFRLFISPKGSSGPTSKWRSGYIHMANLLQCPIVVCGLDYKQKCPVVIEKWKPGSFCEATFQLKMKQIHSLYPENEPLVYT